MHGELKSLLAPRRPVKADRPAEITALIMHQMAANVASAMAFLEDRGVRARAVLGWY